MAWRRRQILAGATALPEVPALAETLPVFEMGIWVGLFAPAGTPAPVVARVNALTREVLALPEVQTRLLSIGADADAGRGIRHLPPQRDRPLDRRGPGGRTHSGLAPAAQHAADDPGRRHRNADRHQRAGAGCMAELVGDIQRHVTALTRIAAG
ncbi:hypothetical protein H7965_18240 [Siccirubricoccus deserti]|uniref:Uncharacterized protein n=1 Tax=Siccirubricoccus deserti TaxID=2013562 RepID=A0A9X0R2Q5_9PROT|nr:hypothetical protein [Siccirubricoccus deserti]